MKKKTVAEKVVLVIFLLLFAIYSISLIFPFVWCFFNSFKSKFGFMNDVWGLPKTWIFSNWADSFSLTAYGVSIGGMFLNSFIFVAVGTLLTMLSSASTAYVISKYRFRGRNAIYLAAVIIMMVPSMGSLAATYKLYVNLGLYNTYPGIFLMYLGGFGTSFLYLYGYFKNLSWSFAEAAFIDGAGHFKTFFIVMLPMALPALGAVGILQAISIWNDYFTVYMYAPDLATIAVGLQNLVNDLESTYNYPQLFAIMLVSMLPIIAIFVVFQKTIMESTAVGGIKG